MTALRSDQSSTTARDPARLQRRISPIGSTIATLATCGV